MKRYALIALFLTQRLAAAIPAPTPVAVTPTGVSGQLALTWAAVTAPAGVVSYTIYQATTADLLTTTQSSVTSTGKLVTGLNDGQPYWFTVAADTGGDQSLSVTAAPYQAPDAPTATALALSYGAGIQVQWTAAGTHGYPVGGYRLEVLSGATVISTRVVAAWLRQSTFSTACEATLTAQVRAVDVLGNVGPASLTVAAAAPCAPVAIAAGLNSSALSLSWTPASLRPVSQYHIRYATSAGAADPLPFLETVLPSSSSAASASAVAVGSSRWYRVYSEDANGVLSAGSNELAVLAPPTDVSASALTGTAVLTWSRPGTASDIGLTGYQVYYATFTPFSVGGALVQQQSVADPGSGSTVQSSVAGLTDGVPVNFAVAVDGGSGTAHEGGLSASISVLTGLVAPVIYTFNSLQGAPPSLAWSSVPVGVNGPATYVVYAATAPLAAPLGLSALAGTSLTLTFSAGSLQYWSVAVSDTAGHSSALLTSTALLAPVLTSPVVSVGVTTNSRVLLQWLTVTAAQEYQVYRATQGVTTTAATFATNSTWVVKGNSFVDTKPVNGQDNLYKVLARAKLGLANTSVVESPLGLTVTGSPGVAPGIPGSFPIGTLSGAYLTASARADLSAVDLSWAPSAAGSRVISTYRVYQGFDVASLSFVSEVASTNTTYSYVAPDPLSRAFGVEAVDLTGTVSPRVTGTPVPYAPWPAPQSLSGFTLGTSARLSWSAPAGQGSYGLSAYKVYRQDQAGASPVLVGITPTTAYNDVTASSASGSTLLYSVSVLDASGLTGTAAQTTINFNPQSYNGVTPTAPTVIVPQALTGTGVPVLLQWQPNPESEAVTAYAVYADGTLLAVTATNSAIDAAAVVGTNRAYQVQALNAAGAGVSGTASPASFPVAPLQPIGAAVNFGVDSTGSLTAALRLQWTDWGVTGGVDSYEVYRTAGVFTGLGGATDLGGTTTTAWTDGSALHSTYYSYAILSKRGSTLSANPVAQVALTSSAALTAPSPLAVTPSSGTVLLRWPAQSAARQYWVYRSTAAQGSAPDIGTRLATVAGVLSYTDASVPSGSLLYYAVAAVSEMGRGPAAEVSTTPLPGVVTGLSALAGFGSGPQVALSWSAPASPALATSYEVKRSLDGSSYSSLGLLTATSYADAAISTGQPYYYTVSSINLGASTNNPVVGPVTAYASPATPTSFRAQGGPGQVNLAWDSPASTQGISGYSLQVVSWDGSLNQSLSLPAQPSAYNVMGLSAAQGVSATLSALNSAGTSGAALATATANAVGAVALPSSFTAKVGYYETSSATVRVILAWNAVGSGSSALLYRSTSPIPLSLAAGGPSSPLYLTGFAGTASQLTDSAVTAGQPYYYALSAVGPDGLPGAESLPVPLNAVSPFSYPSPVQLTVTAGLSRVDLQWSPGAFSGTAGLGSVPYRVYRYQSSSTSSLLGTTPDSGFPARLTVSAYADTQVTNGVTYQYLVTVVDGLGREQDAATGRSGIVPRGPRPAPANLQATAGDGVVDLRWLATQSDTADSLKFNVYRRQASIGQDYGAPVPTLYQTGPSSVQEFQGTVMLVVSARDQGSPTSLTNKETYCYSLTQANDFGESGKSQEVCVTPYRPLKPGSFKLDLAVVGKKDVRLGWQSQQLTDPANAGDYPLASFRVYRSPDGGTNYQLLATLTSITLTTQTFTDNNTQFGVSYVYRVVPVDDHGNEGYSYNLASVVIPAALNAVHIFCNSFNPATGGVAPIQYSLLQPGHAWVRIYTLQGDFVVSVFEEDVPQASLDSPYLSQKRDWDGRNFEGHTVASGVYIVHLEGPGYRANARVAVIK